MKTIADQRTLDQLTSRLERITANSERRWGTLTAPEMLCHLGDASDGVLGRRVTPGSVPGRPLPLPLKWLLLYSAIPFPKGVETRPGVNPRKEGTRPADFERDLARAIDGLRALAVAAPESLPPTHFRFGTMSRTAWHRWAYKHVDHHLRQFGV